MARQTLNIKKTLMLREKLKLPIFKVLVRGGTDHRKDLCFIDGTVMHLYRDGTIEKSSIGCRVPLCLPSPQK